jgi:hypothetical protein
VDDFLLDALDRLSAMELQDGAFSATQVQLLLRVAGSENGRMHHQHGGSTSSRHQASGLDGAHARLLPLDGAAGDREVSAAAIEASEPLAVGPSGASDAHPELYSDDELSEAVRAASSCRHAAPSTEATEAGVPAVAEQRLA